MSLVAFGAGHVYVGHIRRGLALIAGLLAIQIIAISAVFLVAPRFTSVAIYYAAALVAIAGGYLFVVVDAARLARDPKAPSPRWFVIVGAILAIWLCNYVVSELLLRTRPLFPWRTFTVPASSMEPTLLVGDWFFGDMAYFGTHAAARGDVVIYQLPGSPDILFVKRIVALAGDRITFQEAGPSSMAPLMRPNLMSELALQAR